MRCTLPRPTTGSTFGSISARLPAWHRVSPPTNRAPTPPKRHPAACYPPPFAAAIAPAGRLSPAGFQKGAYLVLLVAFWVYAAGLVKLARGQVSASETLIAGVLLFVTPGLNITMSL